MKKTLILLAALLFSTMYTSARRVVFVTVDGYRWQELFSGADSLLIGNNEQLKQIIGKQQPKNAEAC